MAQFIKVSQTDGILLYLCDFHSIYKIYSSEHVSTLFSFGKSHSSQNQIDFHLSIFVFLGKNFFNCNDR
jgi:hypothetical protein